jgi:hypothetical protein
MYGNAMPLYTSMIQAGWSSTSLLKLIWAKCFAEALTLFMVNH